MSFRLDPHGEMLLKQYHDRKPIYKRIDEIVYDRLTRKFEEQGLYINALEHRVKTENSLKGKLELKGSKYDSLADITDILGLRIITFYSDDVDKVAAIVKSMFDVDWHESIDKRKQHHIDSFGYNSLHYICRIPKKLFSDSAMPEINEYRFEIQMRTALEHVWSTIEHDLGYKGGVKIPPEYRRQFSRISGMLELIDDEFSRIRTALTDYRRQMQSLVASGRLDEVSFNAESYRSFLKTQPFAKLNKRIAASNQAEIFPAPLIPFLPILESFRFATLGDLKQFIDDNAEDAYQLAISQLALTDLDILSENIGLLNLCIVHTLKQGTGRYGIHQLYDMLWGQRPENEHLADITYEQAQGLAFMQKQQ